MKLENSSFLDGSPAAVFDAGQCWAGDEWPILVVVGPTASGKTGLAIEVALALGAAGHECEIISADSRAIYKGMDIGTAKPTVAEMRGVPHWGIDLVEPGDRFTVVDFVEYARAKIAEIRERGHFPIIAGGTGLYVDALVYDYQFNDVVKNTYADRQEMSSDYLVIGIDWSREELRQRLLLRSNKLFEQPIEEETLEMVERYGWDSQAMKSDIYPICWEMMRGNISREEAVQLNAVDDWHLAKRQLTWFKRNNNIVWIPLDGAKERISNFYLGR